MKLATLILTLAISVVAQAADHADLEEGSLTFCHFGPKVKVLAAPKGDKCEGAVKVQTVQWACDQAYEAGAKVDKLRRSVYVSAEEECTRYCASKGRGCVGLFNPPTGKPCGLSTDSESAAHFGERFGCAKHCPGRGFIYCSVYDAGFKTDEPALIAKQAPNCRCSQR